jgi:hypothetical protein
MIKTELADAAAQDLLDRWIMGALTQSGVAADGFWCSAMRKNESGSDVRKSSSSAAEPVCGKLRLMFDDVAAEPMPECLASLADQLDSALQRGELFAPKPKPTGR